MFEAIKKVTDNMAKITASLVIETLIARPELNNLIIRLNTQEQLFKKGVDSNGVSLGVYSPFTIIQKDADGLPSDHVTLFQDGDFYKTWKVFVIDGDIIIEADGDKSDKNLLDVYGEDIVGLIEEHEKILIDEILFDTPELVEFLLFA